MFILFKMLPEKKPLPEKKKRKKYRIGDRLPPVKSGHRKPQKYYAPIRPANNNSSNSGKQIK